MTIDDRVEAARRLLRDRRLVVEPGPYFADRVIAQLRRQDGWVFAWAARRVISVTLVVAAVLTIAVVARNGMPGHAVPASSVSETRESSDPLDWLLEAPEGVR